MRTEPTHTCSPSGQLTVHSTAPLFSVGCERPSVGPVVSAGSGEFGASGARPPGPPGPGEPSIGGDVTGPPSVIVPWPVVWPAGIVAFCGADSWRPNVSG